tara:strand:+ start:147 stop:764 length:618 start_codon:yes stop_codon:yes gene_type:complete
MATPFHQILPHGAFVAAMGRPGMIIDFGAVSHLTEKLDAFLDESTIRHLLLPLLQRTSVVSLRTLDWLVTNFAKKHNVVCQTQTNELFNVHNAYKVALSVYRRQNFDPFRRSQRIAFQIDAVTHETTIGQCHFLHWANVNGVLAYARSHLADIEADMNDVAARQRAIKRELKRNGARSGKRKPLSTGTAFKCHVYNVTHTVSFEL